MKRALVLLIACCASMVLLAQQPHWTPVDEGLYSGSTGIIAVIQMDGVEQTSTQMELAAFCGDECRGTAFTSEFPITHRYLAMLNVYGENGHELTFKAYDHSTNQELVDMNPVVTVVFSEDGSGTLFAPLELNFIQEVVGENITFADANVKALCVTNWDTNGDGELSYDEAAAVTDLGEVFKNNTTITSFDELQYFTGLTVVGEKAFYNCSNLTSVVMPNSVTAIDQYAFAYCYYLTSVELPNSLTIIGQYAFSSCNRLASINLPCTVVTIGSYAFNFCYGLVSLEIPASVTSIGNFAFYYCDGLVSLEIPASVTSIGNYAFNYCKGLEQITVAEGNEVFDSRGNCNAIIETATNTLRFGCKSSTIPNTVTTIGYYAFENMDIQSVDIPESVVSIGTNVFGGCQLLEQITVAEGNPVFDSRDNCNAAVETGTNKLVFGCKNTVIPNTVTAIGQYAFCGCNSLTSIAIPNSVTAIDQYAFAYCYYLTSVELPNSLTTIGQYSFVLCERLASINLPNSVATIGSNAFYCCYGLASITSLAQTPPTLGNNAFSYVDKSIPVYAPCGTINSYQTASGWSDFTNYQELECPSYEITATANPTNGGTITGSGTYTQGATCTLTATPAEGYTFVNWTENSETVSTDATYSFEVTEARNLVANFAAQGPVTNYWTPIGGTQYNMTMSGIILIDGVEQTVTTLEVGAFCGDECRGSMMPEFFPPTQQYVVSLTVVSNQQSGENITFRLYDHLTQQELDLQCANSITFVSNAIIGDVGDWYQFAFNSEVSVTATVNPEGAGTIMGTGSYMPGTTATLTATANSGYVFRSWTLNGETVSTDNPYTFTVTGATNLVAQFDLQQISTLQNGWSWWSTYIEMDGNNGLQQLEESMGHNGLMIKTQTPYVQNYYPSLGYDYWFGSLTNVGLTNEAGYQISVSNACQAIVSGAIADAAAHPITVKPGWNWIGYPVATQQGLSTALANFTPAANDLIKGQNSSATYYANYGWFPTSFTLTSGQGYMYYSNATENKTLTYAVSRDNGELEEAAERIWKNDEHAFADNLTVMAVVAIDGEEQRSEELELGAFVGGECRGSAVLTYFEPTDRWYAILTIAGEESEEINFAIINRKEGKINARSANRVVFVENAVVGSLDYPYEVNFTADGALKLYPNPVERSEAFTLVIPSGETVAEVFVYTALGELVSHKMGAQASQRMQGLEVAGVYTVKVVCKSGNTYIGRLIVK